MPDHPQKSKIRFSLSRIYAVLILLLASIFAILPHITLGFPTGHSLLFNLHWEQHFTKQFLSGELFPRWLFDSANGLGTPVFYFYAPVPFYLFSFITAAINSSSESLMGLTIGHCLLFFLSGLAFFLFISHYLDTFWSIAASVLYIFVPYHYINVEVRLAMGESFAYVWLPLIMMGLRHPQKTWNRLFFSGFCYGGLILSHIPSALLAAPIIVIFSVCVAEPSRRLAGIFHAFWVGIVGVGLSSVYLVPALRLQNTMVYDGWVTAVGPHFDPVNWLIGNSEGLPSFGVIAYGAIATSSLLGISSTLALATALLLIKRPIYLEKTRWQLVIACLIAILGCWFLMTNLSHDIWKYSPILPKVQFPWRLGVVVDFCSLLLFSLTFPLLLTYFPYFPTRKVQYCIKSRYIIVIIVVFFATSVINLRTLWLQDGNTSMRTFIHSRDEIANHFLLPIEYRTKWLSESSIYLDGNNAADLLDINFASQIHKAGKQNLQLFVEKLPPLESLRALKPEEFATLEKIKATSFSISARLESAATIRLKKFYYPHWQLMSKASNEAIDVYADAQTGLLLFELPAGKHDLILNRRLLVQEKAGLGLSLISMVTSLAMIRILGHRRV